MLNEIVGSNEALKFLRTLSFSQEKKQFFIDLHKFSLSFNENLSSNYFAFYHDYNNVVFSGGCIRDALLLDLDSIKDLDLTFHLAAAPIKTFNFYSHDLFFNNEVLASFKELGVDDFIEYLNSEKLKNPHQFPNINHKEQLKVLNTLSEFYSYKFEHPDLAFRKHIATHILTKNFDCDLTYNKRKTNTDEVIDDTYGSLIQDSLMGIIKSKIKITNKEYPCDFLLVRDQFYSTKCFDFHICQAQFPHSPLSLFSPSKNVNDFTTYFLSSEYKSKIKELYNNECEYLAFIEENLDDDELFLHYLSQYLSLTSGFILNAERKIFTFNNYNHYEIKNSFRSHYKRLFSKYSYPLVLYKEQEQTSSIFEIIKKDNFDVLLW